MKPRRRPLTTEEKQTASRLRHSTEYRRSISERRSKNWKQIKYARKKRLRVIAEGEEALRKQAYWDKRNAKAAAKKQALADERNKPFFRAYNLESKLQQGLYLKLRANWSVITVSQLIAAGLLTEAQREAAMQTISVQ